MSNELIEKLDGLEEEITKSIESTTAQIQKLQKERRRLMAIKKAMSADTETAKRPAKKA